MNAFCPKAQRVGDMGCWTGDVPDYNLGIGFVIRRTGLKSDSDGVVAGWGHPEGQKLAGL